MSLGGTGGYFCLSGVGTHDAVVLERLGLQDLDGVETELTTMRQTLMSLGLREHLAFEGKERRHDHLARDLRNIAPPSDAETLVIYCTGHGVVEDTRFSLLLPDGDMFNPARLVEPFGAQEWRGLREIVLIIDACSAEPGLDAALAGARMVNTQTSTKGLWGIGSSRRREEAKQGSFADAFAEAVRDAVRPSWTVSHLDPGALARQVNQALPDQTVWLADGHPAEPCTALPDPRHQNPDPPKGRLPLPAEWATSARGVADTGLPGFFFTGRTDLLQALRTHLTGTDDGPPVAVVTGGPRVGKTALLGHLFLTAHEGAHRELPGEVRMAWPPLPVTPAAGRGTPSQVTGMLLRDLGGSRELTDVLRAAPAPVAVVLDGLDEGAGPEEWARLFTALRSVPGVRVVVGLPHSSAVDLAGPVARVHDLDDLREAAAGDVRAYLRQQVRLTVPRAAREAAGRVDGLAARAGDEWEVAVSVTLQRVTRGRPSLREYLARAEKEVDEAAHAVCSKRVRAVLGEKARGIVSALSALSDCGDTVALPTAEWAAAASAPGGPLVDEADVVLAARLMGSLVEVRPAADGTDRWRTRFRHTEGGGKKRAEEFLQRLPQVADWEKADWQAVDPGVLVLVSRAATLGLIPGRLIDDPAFLLGVPPEVAYESIRRLEGNRSDRARRARMWRLVPREAPAGDRALLLRIGAERHDVQPVVTAFRGSRGLSGSAEVDWVQPERARTTRVTGMAVTAPGPHAAVVTVRDDDTLAFFDPRDGTALRSPVAVPGSPRDVTVAVVGGRAVALVSTWRQEIWRVACDEDTAPVPAPELAPPGTARDDGGRPAPLLLSLHPAGHVVVAAGRDAWTGPLDASAPIRRLLSTDSEVSAVRTAGPPEAPVAWLVSESGRIRRLWLDETPGPALSPFPLPLPPLATAVSDSGDQALVVDVSGALHLRGAGGDAALTAPWGQPRAVALDETTAVVGGSRADGSGRLDIHHWSGPTAVTHLPLDDAVVGVALHGKDHLLVARTCGLLSLTLAGRHD